MSPLCCIACVCYHYYWAHHTRFREFRMHNRNSIQSYMCVLLRFCNSVYCKVILNGAQGKWTRLWIFYQPFNGLAQHRYAVIKRQVSFWGLNSRSRNKDILRCGAHLTAIQAGRQCQIAKQCLRICSAFHNRRVYTRFFCKCNFTRQQF